MRRWNGWGDDSNDMPLREEARAFLAKTLSPSTPLPDATLAQVVAKVPPSRLPSQRGVDASAEVRVRHARGQSFADWLAVRSGEFGSFPDGVAEPTTSDEVRALLEYAAGAGADVIPYGGGTSVAGHINPEKSERPVLTISLAKMDRMTHLDRESQLATFGAGTPGPSVERQLAPHGYVLGHYPQSFELSTVGGWVASRSSGQQSLRYGRIEQLFAGGVVETPKGRLTIPTFPASSAGPDIRELVLGSEGRIGIITEAKLRVTRAPEVETFRVFFVPSWSSGLDLVRELVQRKLPLSMVRLSNAEETRTQLIIAGHKAAIRLLEAYLTIRGADSGKTMLTVGLTGSRAQVGFGLSELKHLTKEYAAVDTGTVLGKKWEENRFRSPYLRHGLWDHGYGVDTFETATDWPNVDGLIAAAEGAVRSAAAEFGEKVQVFTHLSHVYGQGSSCYTTYIFRVQRDYERTLAMWAAIKKAASEAIVAHRGTISHQHGVGVDHAPYLAREKGELGMSTLGALASHLDPDARMNPGKLLRKA